MATLPLKQRIELTANSGVETGVGGELNKEQIDALKDALDRMAAKYTNTFGRTSAFTPTTVKASKSLASFFNSKQDTTATPENNDKPTKKMR